MREAGFAALLRLHARCHATVADQLRQGGMSDGAVRVFARVWDAVEETPQAASCIRLRSELAMGVRDAVEGWRVTQARAARRLGVTQPRLNDLLRGRVARFGLDALGGSWRGRGWWCGWRLGGTRGDAGVL